MATTVCKTGNRVALSSEPQIWKFHVVVRQKTCARKCAARAVRLYFSHSTNHIFDLWRCGCRRDFISSLLKNLLRRNSEKEMCVSGNNQKLARKLFVSPLRVRRPSTLKDFILSRKAERLFFLRFILRLCEETCHYFPWHMRRLE